MKPHDRDNDQGEAVELSVRTCRWCGSLFSWPKGRRQEGCPRCAPALEYPDGRSWDDVEANTA